MQNNFLSKNSPNRNNRRSGSMQDHRLTQLHRLFQILLYNHSYYKELYIFIYDAWSCSLCQGLQQKPSHSLQRDWCQCQFPGLRWKVSQTQYIHLRGLYYRTHGQLEFCRGHYSVELNVHIALCSFGACPNATVCKFLQKSQEQDLI